MLLKHSYRRDDQQWRSAQAVSCTHDISLPTQLHAKVRKLEAETISQVAALAGQVAEHERTLEAAERRSLEAAQDQHSHLEVRA